MQSTSVRRAVVEPGGSGVVAHVGLHAIGTFADRLGLGDLLSDKIISKGERRPVHDRGKALTQMALVLAGGGESCADIEHLRFQPELFGQVPSDSTVFRAIHELDGATLERLAAATSKVRAEIWRRSAATSGNDPVVLDIDASLVEIHSEHKEQTAANYKGGFGFHPMFCFADATGEALAGVLRPGNAGANTVTDHVTVLDQAIAQLPEEIQQGHRAGDGRDTVLRAITVRADTAGCTEGFLSAARSRNVNFCVTVRTSAQITSAIFDAENLPGVWLQAVTKDGEPRQGAAVGELTELVSFDQFPTGTRLIIRREPLHGGAQRSLFPSLQFRYWGFVTDLDGDPRVLDQHMREHAHVEQHLERLKDSGLCSFPFSKFCANEAWLFLVRLAADLVRWFQLLCLDRSWRNARPKTLRWGLLHAPGHLVRRSRKAIIRIVDGWPATEVLLDAYTRINLLT